MTICPEAAMREVRLVALCLDPVHIILRSRTGDRLAADQDHRRVIDEADRLKRRFGIVAQVDEQARRREQRDVVDQDCRAVRRRSGNTIVGQRAAAADHVLDDDGLAERARHPLADETRDSIRAAASRERDHQRHGLRGRLRIGLRRKRRNQQTKARDGASKGKIDHDGVLQSLCFLLLCRIVADVRSLAKPHRRKQRGTA
jgi:hypothetical protein